jgi:hypothetical protein
MTTGKRPLIAAFDMRPRWKGIGPQVRVDEVIGRARALGVGRSRPINSSIHGALAHARVLTNVAARKEVQ